MCLALLGRGQQGWIMAPGTQSQGVQVCCRGGHSFHRAILSGEVSSQLWTWREPQGHKRPTRASMCWWPEPREPPGGEAEAG